jgi:regulator of sigma E protease
MLLTLIIFILILGLLIFVHEFGHFWAAKRSGVIVHEFAFGFKPRLFAWKRGETTYAINLIPMGGYVRLEGENEEASTGAGDSKKGSLMAQPPKKRAFIMVAGVTMNLILAWILLTFTYALGSYPLTPTFDAHPGLDQQANVILAKINPNSPAATAGFAVGDKVVAIAGQSVTSAQHLTEMIKQQTGQPIEVQYQRHGVTQTATVTPRVNPPAGEGALGVTLGEATVVRTAWYKAPWVALLEVGSEIKSTFVGFATFVANLFVKGEVSKDVSGIIGVGSAVGVVRRLGVAPLMQFTAYISTNLAVINILPILPLDGGHLLFVIIEAIRKKRVNLVYKNWVAVAGLAAILLLFLVVTYQDILTFSIVDRLKALF